MMGSSCIYIHVQILDPIATCMGFTCSMYKEKINTVSVRYGAIAPSSEIWFWSK